MKVTDLDSEQVKRSFEFIYNDFRHAIDKIVAAETSTFFCANNNN